MAAQLEHANITVTDPDRTAQMLCDLFDWHVRWSGRSMLGGNTVHVGSDTDYIAVWAAEEPSKAPKGQLNHLGILVDDLDATEARVVAAGLEPYNHMEYEPGRRFYFDDPDGVEYEVVSYG
ncbi:MAG: VOC family protein [Acidimicrobiales bacterium]|nr:VOC family protein [Acidimicrobiales bacterium]